jgi:hypothetical protein
LGDTLERWGASPRHQLHSYRVKQPKMPSSSESAPKVLFSVMTW